MIAGIHRANDLSGLILNLMAGVKGMKHRRARPRKASDSQVLASIENRLLAHGLGEIEMTQTQVQAAKAVYDKLRPSLSAIDQNITDARDTADANQLASRLAALFNEKPHLFEQVIALKNAASPQQAATSPSDQHVTH